MALSRNPVSSHFQALGSELVRRGHRVFIISPAEEFDPSPLHPGPQLVCWPSVRPTRLADAALLWRLIGKHKPDCLIANFAPVNWMCIVGWMRNVPHRIAWYHTLSSQVSQDWRKPRYLLSALKLRKRWVYRTATHVATNSKAAIEDVHAVFGVAREKCKVWHNSLPDPLPAMQLVPVTARQNTIVCAGRFDKTKGQDVLVRALALLRGRLDSITIEFLGEGPTLETVRASAKAAGLAERCVFRGRVTHEEVLAAMSHAAITVVPSRSEAFGLVNIESMAVGTPVIASAVGGIPEILRDGVDGYLVPPDRPAVLAERLLHVLESLSLRDSMSQSSRNRFLKLYEQCKVVTAQADWLDGIVSGNERSPAEIQKCPADESLRHAGRALG